MRFVNTNTLRFEDVPDSTLEAKENSYAILSHRWGAAQDEISFADVNQSRDFSHKKGFAKFKGFCDLAASLGYRYGWNDTCCINKGDFSELSEAINSMYRWYQVSSICIVYLEDVPEKRMLDSGWFDRGWTLQELIGPKIASFYDRDWDCIGTKSELLGELSSKTGIPENVLSHTTSPATCSIAQRMSWAAKRETTRIEDRAYSLLGLFGVSLPQIYGEREKAFLRLQRAIIQQTKDESIFAWSMGLDSGKQTYSGLFAQSPSFADCSDVISTPGSTGFYETNGELSITVPTFPYSMETFYAVFNCTTKICPDSRIAILVSRLPTDNGYVRAKKNITGSRALIWITRLEKFTLRDIRVPLEPTEPPLNRAYGFWLRTLEPPGHKDCQVKLLSRSSQSETDKVFLEEMTRGTAGVVYLEPKLKEPPMYSGSQSGWSQIRWIKFGFDDDFNPFLLLANDQYQMTRRATEDPFRQATESEADSQARKELFYNRWIGMEGSVPSRSHGWSSGISILKIDRRRGISGTLRALNLGISVKLVPALSPNTPSADEKDEGLNQVWAVDITDTGDCDPEQDASIADKNLLCVKTWTYALQIFCCCFGLWVSHEQLDFMESEKNSALLLTKTLDASDLE